MNNINFITSQDIINSLYSSGGLQKSAGFAKFLMPFFRRVAAGIPQTFSGKWWGPKGVLGFINWAAGGGRKALNAAGTANIWRPTRGVFNTTNGGWLLNNINKIRNFLQDASYQGYRRLGIFDKKLGRWITASDKAAFGSPTIRKQVIENGKAVWKDVPNPLYKKWPARLTKGLGFVGGIGAVTGAWGLPVVGDVMSGVFNYATPIGLLAKGTSSGYGALKDYVTDNVVVPEATNAAYNAMNSTLQGVNNMDTMQRLGFLLSPQQAQAQMQAQAEQEFAQQAWAKQRELWKQRRGE